MQLVRLVFVFISIGAAGWGLIHQYAKPHVATSTIIEEDFDYDVAPIPLDLHDPDWRVRASAARYLSQHPNPATLTNLLSMLEDSDSDVREIVVLAIAVLGSIAVPGLIEILYGGTLNGKVAAAHALGKIGDPAASGPLAEALKDESSWVRLAAAQALANIKSSDAVSSLIASLKDSEKEVREAAAAALQAIGTPEALQPISA